MKHEIIILDHNRGQLANQLWNYMSIYAYCLERGYRLRNPSFGDYRHFFQFNKEEPFIDAVFFNRFKKRKLFVAIRPYHRYSSFIKKMRSHAVIESGGPSDTIIHLPPSTETPAISKCIHDLEQQTTTRLYFCGGRFRNPIGIEKYRKEICSYFRPTKNVEASIKEKLNASRLQYEHIIGVHIRQTDFKTDNKGHYVPPHVFVSAMSAYVGLKKYALEKTLFIICSDEEIDQKVFAGFNIIVNKGTMIEDLYTLAATDAIIGSNSSFGAFAAYHGNIPLIVVDNSPIDWGYYQDKNQYFENKYCTLVVY